MTATLPRLSMHDALRARLEDLYVERTQAVAEATVGGTGDAADRATNVEAQVRLAVLEDRIMAIEEQLSAPVIVVKVPSGVVAEESTVTVDFGDGPETYLVASVERAGVGVDVITPGSQLGRALIGASAGSEITYSPTPRRTATVKVLTVE